MTRMFLCALVLLATPLLPAQQQPGTPPPYTQPTFPDNHPQSHQPPVLPEQQSQMTSSDIQQQIQETISEDPTLSDAMIHAKVDEQSITLTGTAQSETQHRRVLQTVQPYTGQRKVVDKIVVKEKA
jgi:BON domain